MRFTILWFHTRLIQIEQIAVFFFYRRSYIFAVIPLYFQIKTDYTFYLFLPFAPTVWLTIFSVFITSTLGYCLLNFIASETERNRDRHNSQSPNLAAWYVTQIWLSQSKLKYQFNYFYIELIASSSLIN